MGIVSIRRVASRVLSPRAQQEVDRLLDRGDEESAKDYMCDLIQRAVIREDMDEDMAEACYRDLET